MIVLFYDMTFIKCSMQESQVNRNIIFPYVLIYTNSLIDYYFLTFLNLSIQGLHLAVFTIYSANKTVPPVNCLLVGI